MSAQWTGSSFVARCKACGWRTSSQTRRVVEHREAEHAAACEGGPR